MIHRLVFVFMPVALSITGCSSSSKKDEPQGATASGLSRFMDKGFDRKKKEFDKNIRNQFDQKNFAADKKVKERQFKTDSFSGKHDYNGKDEYKAKEFSQSDKKTREEGESFSGADKKSNTADKDFATKDSRFGSQQSKEGDKSFSGSDDVFKTRMVSDAAKSQKKNTKPLIVPKEGEGGKSAYTEEEVRRMVNRN